MVRLRAQRVLLVRVQQDDVRIAADADGALLREHAEDLRGVGGGDLHELVHGDALLVHAFAEEQFHAVFDGGVAVGDLREIVLAHLLLLPGERAVVRGHDLDAPLVDAGPELRLVLLLAQGRAHHPLRAILAFVQ